MHAHLHQTPEERSPQKEGFQITEQGEPTAIDEPVEVQDSRKMIYPVRGIYGINLKSMKKNRKITACSWLDLEITKILTDYAQKSPRTRFGMSRVDYMLSLGMEPGKKNVSAVDFTHC